MNSIHAQLQSINEQLGYFDHSVKEGEALNRFHDNVNEKALQLGSCAQAFGNCLSSLGALPSIAAGGGGGGGGGGGVKRDSDDHVCTNINVYVNALPADSPAPCPPAAHPAALPAAHPAPLHAPRPASCYYTRAEAPPSRWGSPAAAPCDLAGGRGGGGGGGGAGASQKRGHPWGWVRAAEEGPRPQKRWCQGAPGAVGGPRPASSRPPAGRPSSGRRARPASGFPRRYDCYAPRAAPAPAHAHAPFRFQPVWEGMPVAKAAPTWDGGAATAAAVAACGQAYDAAFLFSAMG